MDTENSKEGEGLDVSEYLAVLRRRRWCMILPVVLIVPIMVFVALTLPPTYRSTATILIEQQQSPQDLVRTTGLPFQNVSGGQITLRVSGSGNNDTITEYSLIPIPAAAWLFGSAVLALLGFGYRRKIELKR